MSENTISGRQVDYINQPEVLSNLGLPELNVHQPIEFLETCHNCIKDDLEQDDGEGGFCPLDLVDELSIHEDLVIKITQADTAFNGIEADETGSVVWGASLCLAKYLRKDMVKDKKVIELGCGAGVPSMVAHKYQAQHVLATDFELPTLERMDRHAKINHCSRDSFEIRFIDWERHDPHDDFVADMVISSDIIYGLSKVPSIVKTIGRYLTTSSDGRVLFATRDRRLGVQEFLDLMIESNFELVDSIQCLNRGQNNVPRAFQSEYNLYRWQGDHTIYIFRRNPKK
mmetsp:Transcript_14892/g.22908  ORF Transcript_14892/g.22908 Transcript_14892/m.22908 type:complete len:285 (-) Transcript_14892:403-1257(-)